MRITLAVISIQGKTEVTKHVKERPCTFFFPSLDWIAVAIGCLSIETFDFKITRKQKDDLGKFFDYVVYRSKLHQPSYSVEITIGWWFGQLDPQYSYNIHSMSCISFFLYIIGYLSSLHKQIKIRKTQVPVVSSDPFSAASVFFSLAVLNKIPNFSLVSDFFGDRKSIVRVPPYASPPQINFRRHRKLSWEKAHTY